MARRTRPAPPPAPNAAPPAPGPKLDAPKLDAKGHPVPVSPGGTTMGDRIKAARVAAGLTQEQVARQFGIKGSAVTQWESDASRPESRRMGTLAAMLRVSLDHLVRGEGPPPRGAPPPPPMTIPDHDIATLLPNARPVELGRADLPVLGKAQGGPDGHFSLAESPIEWVARPAALAGIRDAYALVVENDSMTDFGLPEGTVMHVHPHRGPRTGGYCVLVKTNGDNFVKRYIARRGGKVVVEQSNPRKVLEFPEREIRAVHRITSVSYD